MKKIVGTVAVLSMTLLASSPASADTILSIPDTEFIIPVFAGESIGDGNPEGVLNLFSDGSSAEGLANLWAGAGDGAGVSGNPFNPLSATQTFTMPGRSVYEGSIVLNLHFFSPEFLLPIQAATLKFTLFDLDFDTDDIALDGTILLQEMAVIDTVNGQVVNLDLAGYTNAPTDDASVDIEVSLNPAHLSADPSILSLTLGARIENKRYTSVKLENTKEALLSNLSLRVTQVPEPSALWLLGSGLTALIWIQRRHF